MRYKNAVLIQDATEFVFYLNSVVWGVGCSYSKDECVQWLVRDFMERMYFLPIENHWRHHPIGRQLGNMAADHPMLERIFYATIKAPLLHSDCVVKVWLDGRDLYINYYRDKIQ